VIFGAARVAPEKAVFRPALPMSFPAGLIGQHMATMSFKEQYLHPNWQRKRLEVMEAAGFECENCGDSESTLNVHHRQYVKGRMVWEYERHELQCLCETCHLSHHKAQDLLKRLVSPAMDIAPNQIVALLAGFLEGLLGLDESIDVASIREGEFGPEFDLGILASILLGQMPDGYLKAFEAIDTRGLTPPQDAAIERWRRFLVGLEKSGL
jgi:hypothetical protein